MLRFVAFFAVALGLTGCGSGDSPGTNAGSPPAATEPAEKATSPGEESAPEAHSSTSGSGGPAKKEPLCGAPAEGPQTATKKHTTAPTSVPEGGSIAPGLYHLTSEDAFEQSSEGSGGPLHDAIRIDATKLHQNRSIGLERRYRYTTSGTDLLLSGECLRDQPDAAEHRFGYTANATTLVIFKANGKVVSTYTRQGD